jgi:hypothetical protein
MSGEVIPPAEPKKIGEHVVAEAFADRSGAGVDAEQVREGVAALSELAAVGVEVDGEIQVTETTWAIYGHISYDGEIVVGEYHDAAVASAILRAAPHRRADHDGSGP